MATPSSGGAPLDVMRVRERFPALAREVGGRPLRYLDSASTTLRPEPVLEAVRAIEGYDSGNVHRGVHALSASATARYEEARERVRRFLGAASAGEIVFTGGTTASVNLVAQTFGRQRVGPGDEVMVSVMEHHSNLVPWHMLCAERGARLVPIPLDAAGALDLDRYAALLTGRTRLVAITHASNVTGAMPPLDDVVRLARGRGAAVVVDGAQAVAHVPVDVAALGCDFYCFSGHKVFGPTGVGVLWGRREHLLAMPPWQGGGNMIRTVRFDGVTFADPPARFEAGTPPIAGVVGLGSALEFVEALGWEAIAAHEQALVAHALAVLRSVAGLRLHGPGGPRVPAFAFSLAGVHPHDLATVLAEEGFAIRGGHHCAQPLHDHLGVAATARASLSLYNTAAEIDALAEALARARDLFARPGQ